MTPSHAVKKGTRYRYYVSGSLITKDRTENSAALRIPAAEIEQLVSNRVHRWLLDPGSIYKSTSTRLADSSMQQRLVARAAEIGKHWPELPVARKRAVLTALIERIEVSVDQIDIRLRPPRLGALLDGAATPSQGVNDDETEILSVPVRLRRAGREIRMVIDGTDPFAAAKPDARLIKLLLRARRFNAALDPGRRHRLCCTRPAGRCQPVLFHAPRPPQLSRAGYYPGDPRWAAAARSDGREAPRALTSAACLARSADRARLCLSPIRIQRSTARLSPEKARLCRDRRGILADHHQRHCGTGIWPDRDIAAGWRAYRNSLARLCRPDRQASRPHPRGKPGFSTFESGCGRETDCLLEEAVRSELVSEGRNSLLAGKIQGNSSILASDIQIFHRKH